jgi:hypothetical protein
MVDDGVEIWGGRAVADADDSEDLAVGLEVFPGTGRGAAEDELEPEAAGVPGLMRERRLLMLRVERAHPRERDRLVPLQHRPVLPQEALRDRPDRQDRHSDHARSLDAHVWLHSRDRRVGRRVSLWGWAYQIGTIRIDDVRQCHPKQSARARERVE